jgi:acetyl esterase/lipase
MTFLTAALLSVFSGKAQDTLPLYPAGVPGLKPGISIAEEAITTDGITRVRHVSEPEIYVFRPEKQTSDAAVIICPGGGYGILAIDHEGSEIAQWFNERGITAFVLKYRLPEDDLFDNPSIRPLEDAQTAIRLVRQQAATYGLRTDRIGVMGFSAGGHLAAMASTACHSDTERTLSRPDFTLLLYPVISFDEAITHGGSRSNLIGDHPSESEILYYSPDRQVSSCTPPVFLVTAADDPVNPENSIRYFEACRKQHIPAEIHIFEKGGHGYALKKRGLGPVESWPSLMEAWLRERGLMK